MANHSCSVLSAIQTSFFWRKVDFMQRKPFQKPCLCLNLYWPKSRAPPTIAMSSSDENSKFSIISDFHFDSGTTASSGRMSSRTPTSFWTRWSSGFTTTSTKSRTPTNPSNASRSRRTRGCRKPWQPRRPGKLTKQSESHSSRKYSTGNGGELFLF